MSTPSTHLSTLQTQGYVKIPSLLPSHLLLALQAAAKYTTDRARNGKWPYIRTVPKQYPPWPEYRPEIPRKQQTSPRQQQHDDAEAPNIWGIQHLLHPDMPVRDTFAEVYFCDEVLDVVRDLLAPSATTPAHSEGGKGENPDDDGNLVMELFNLLVSPARHESFSLAWHRDDIRPDVSSDEELSQLNNKSPNGRQSHAQYNIALFPDSSLIVIPGSHRRIRTESERHADPDDSHLPGQIVVDLQPGDAVFYDSNILHRGVYEGIDAGRELGRMTLHGSVGLAGEEQGRARQVLQHGVGEWVGGCGFEMLEGEKRRRAEVMRRRLVEMGKGEGAGFSLVG